MLIGVLVSRAPDGEIALVYLLVLFFVALSVWFVGRLSGLLE